MKLLNVIDLGTMPYEDAYFLQKAAARSIRLNGDSDCALVVEHPNIFTIGRTGSRKNILADKRRMDENGLKIIDVDRGGDITFHGSGQVVVYPIFDLNRHEKNIRLFLRNLERVLEMTVSAYGLTPDDKNGRTGLWVGGSKISFIGIGISNWVTYHGISINANVDLSYFSMIRPCGIDDLKVSSLQNILNRHIELDPLKDIFLKNCCEVFGFESIHRCSEDAVMAEKRSS